jgi:hypothetical protein
MDLSDYIVEGASGPAQSTKTRTPIVFQRGTDPNLEGQHDYGNNLQYMLSLLPMMKKLRPAGTITINTDSPDNQKPGAINSTIRHESAHALIGDLDAKGRLLGQGFSNLNPTEAQVNQLAPFIRGRIGDPRQEIPAYAAEQNGLIPEDQRQQFVQQFAQQLANVSPRGAAIYKSLAGVK